MRPSFVLSLAFTMAVTTAVHASGVAPGDATAPQKKEAMTHFTTGKQAAESKEWEKALVELRASLAIVDSPNGRLVLARTLRDSGALGDAWTEYGRTIEVATRLADKDPRYAQTAEAAKTERAELDAKVGLVVVSIAHAPADATLKVGGRGIPSAEWSGPIVASAGAVDVVVADAAGKELARKTVAVTTGGKTPVALDTQPSSEVAAAPAGAPSAEDLPPKDKPEGAGEGSAEAASSPSGNGHLRAYAYAAGGVGVAGFAVFGIFGAMEKSTYSTLQSSCPGNVCPPDKAGDISSGKTQQLLANVGLGVGIAGVAVGTTLFVLSLGGNSSTAPQAASTSLVVSPNFIGLRGAL
jgi:hypothetical protein